MNAHTLAPGVNTTCPIAALAAAPWQRPALFEALADRSFGAEIGSRRFFGRQEEVPPWSVLAEAWRLEMIAAAAEGVQDTTDTCLPA